MMTDERFRLKQAALVAISVLILIFMQSVYAYTIDGDTVYQQWQHADLSVYPHTIKDAWEWQNFLLYPKTSGDVCLGYKAPERPNGWAIERKLQDGTYKDAKGLFSYKKHGGYHYIYTSNSFSVDAYSSKEWRLRYGHRDTDWKTHLIMWNSVSGDCLQDYKDGPQILYDLDPWAVSTDFNSCRNISILGAQDNLTDFPMYIQLTDTTDMTEADIRFVDAPCDESGDLMDFEVERFRTDNVATWVKRNISTENFTISVYYNNSLQEIDGQNPTDVWDDNYTSVWHFATDSGAILIDSKANDNGTSNDATSWINSSFGGGMDFDGTTDYIGNLNTVSALDTQNTIMIVLNADDTSSTRQLISHVTQVGQETIDVNIGANKLENAKYDGGATRNSEKGFTDTLNDHLFYGTWDDVTNGIRMSIDKVNGSIGSGFSLSGVLSFNIGRRVNGDRYYDGIIDEIRLSNNIRSVAWRDYTYDLMFNQSEFVNITPKIFNPFQGFTAIEVLDLSPLPDFAFSSSTFVEASRTAFNLTTPREATFTGSMNIVKLTSPPSQSDISIRIDLDDIPIHQERLMTNLGVNNVRSAGIEPFIVNIPGGEHNISVLYSRSVGSTINISNQNIMAIIGESSDNNSIDISRTVANFTISSSSVSPVFSWNISKSVEDTDTFIFTKQNTDSSANNVMLQYFNDTEDLTISPYWSRYTGSTDFGSVLGLWIDENESDTHEHDIMGSVTAGSVDIDSTIVHFDLADENGRIVHNTQTSDPATDLDNDKTVNPGTTTLFNVSHSILSGDGILIALQISSESGTTSNTPTFVLSTDTDSSYTQKRSFSAPNRPGNVIMFDTVSSDINESVNTSLSVTVTAGETLDILDEAVTMFDIEFIQGEIGNTPPIFVDVPVDATLQINATQNATFSYLGGNWTDIQGTDVSISDNCTQLISEVDNSTDNYNVTGTFVYPADVGVFVCELTLTDIGGLSAVSDSFTITIENITFVSPPVEPPAEVDTELEFIGCTSDTTQAAILLMGFVFLMGLLSLTAYLVKIPIYSIFMSIFMFIFAWYIAECFLFSIFIFILLGFGNLIHGLFHIDDGYDKL